MIPVSGTEHFIIIDLALCRNNAHNRFKLL